LFLAVFDPGGNTARDGGEEEANTTLGGGIVAAAADGVSEQFVGELESGGLWDVGSGASGSSNQFG